VAKETAESFTLVHYGRDSLVGVALFLHLANKKMKVSELRASILNII
jgi:hypothetical protein